MEIVEDDEIEKTDEQRQRDKEAAKIKEVIELIRKRHATHPKNQPPSKKVKMSASSNDEEIIDLS